MKLLILDTFFVILLGLVNHTQPSRITNAPTNFRNLFRAQSENNVRKTEGDCKIMEQEIANNQKVFNILKNELQHLRERPAKKQKYNVRRNRDTSKEAASSGSQNSNVHAKEPGVPSGNQDGSNAFAENYRIDERPLSRICIEEVYSSNTKLSELSLIDLGYVIGKMDEKFQSERECRLTYESMVDFRETVLLFLNDCYPKWAPERGDRECNEHMLHITLLNIEHPKVKSMRIYLSKNGMTEETFIKKIMIGIMPVRHAKAHHVLMDEERPAAYSVLNKHLDPEERLVVDSFLKFRTGSIIDETDSLGEKSTLVQEIESTRKSLRLIRIPSYVYHFHDEDFLRKKWGQYAKEAKVTEGNPIAFFATAQTNGAYLLFDDFKNAYAFWHMKESTGLFYPNEMASMVIEDIEKGALWGGVCYIQIKAVQEDKTTTKTLDKTVIKEKYPPFNLQMTAKSDIAMCQYESFEQMMRAYEYLKTKFESVSIFQSIPKELKNRLIIVQD